MVKIIDASKYLDLTSAQWNAMGIDRAAKAYDSVVAYGERAAKQIAKAVKPTLYKRASSLISDASAVANAAMKATTNSFRKAGRYFGDIQKGMIKTAKEGIQIYGDSETYKKVQDMYKGYTNKDTQDRTERINAETEARTGSASQRTYRTLRNMKKNAKEYDRLRAVCERIAELGGESSPLQIYTLMNGDIEAYKRMIASNSKPWITIKLGRNSCSFETMDSFMNFLRNMNKQAEQAYFMEMMRNSGREERNGNAQEQSRANAPRQEQEMDITNDIEVSQPAYRGYGGIERKLLGPGVN